MAQQIFVSTIAGKTSAYQLDTNRTTVAELLDRVADKEGMDKDTIRLIFGGRDLTGSTGQLLSNFGVRAGATVQVVFRMIGGAYASNHQYQCENKTNVVR